MCKNRNYLRMTRVYLIIMFLPESQLSQDIIHICVYTYDSYFLKIFYLQKQNVNEPF